MPLQKDPRRLRIGVIGAGPIAQFAHLDACRRGRNTELYAICDVAADLLARVAALHPAQKTFTSFEEMLADPDLDAVLVATADAFHVPLAERALQSGKHVFVEKPLGIAVEECEHLCELVERTGRVLQVGCNRRFDPALVFAHAFLREQVGNIAVANAWYCDSVFRYTMTDNLQPLPMVSQRARKPAEDPKADKRKYFLLAHASHLFDTALFLAGRLGAVRARWQESAGAHYWSIAGEFVSGAFGHLTMIVPARGDFEEGVQVFGDGGSVQGRLHLPWYRKAGEVACFSAADGVYHRPLGADGDTYRLQLEAFASTILDGTAQHGASARDGLHVVRALAAATQSADQQRTVALDQVTGAV